MDTVTELYNEATDILWSCGLWAAGARNAGALTLFWVSLTSLALQMLGRAWVAWDMRADVDDEMPQNIADLV